MINRLSLIAAFAVLAVGCGSTPTAQEPVSTAVSTVAAPKPIAVTVFRVDNGLLRPSVVRVPATSGVASAALHALGQGPGSVIINDGTATVGLTGTVTQDRQAEIVYTLTQFGTIKRVDVGGRTGLTRDDFPSYVPPIFVESPAAGAEVGHVFHVSGTASVFEATLVVQLVRNGTVVSKHTVTASEGAPGRGTFETTMMAPEGAFTISAFSPSAVDGSPQHQVDVPVTVKFKP
jgi:hypothetical protein